jgi:hypothetical protein
MTSVAGPKPRSAMNTRLSLVLGWSLALGLGALQAFAGSPLPLQHRGNTTYDPNTELEWLDLTLTAGQSYSSVLNGWHGYTTLQGFRFATRNEVTQLFTDAGAAYLGYPVSPTTADLQAARLVLSLLGTTLAQTDLSRSWMYYDASTEPTLPTPDSVPSAVVGVGEIFAGYPQEGVFLIPGLFPTRDYGASELASALVRPIPEPSPAILMGAFLGVSFLVRKRQ